MIRVPVFVPGIFLAACLFAAQDGYCAIYKYLDTDGLVNFADDLQSIPVQYRAFAIIVSGGPEPGAVSAGSSTTPARTNMVQKEVIAAGDHQDASVEVASAPEKKRKPFAWRATVSAIIVVTVMFLFTLMRILDHDNKKSVAVARVVLLWVMTVYLLYAHVGDVLRAVGLMGDSVQSVRGASEEKGRKAAAAIKSMQQFMEQIHNEQGGTSSTVPEPEERQ